jgi:hypothetical protein
MKLYFLSFGNNRYNHALYRIRREAVSLNIFNHIYIYNENELKQFNEFWDKHKDFILLNSRGYGYWIWKPFLVKYILSLMDENDILVYADAGCQLNPLGIDKFRDYINIVNNSNSGILSFQLQSEHLEKRWTKMDLFNYLQCHDLADTNQLIATSFIIKKNDKNVQIVNQWYELACNYHLIDDTPSISKNYDIFVEHRHDQSIFSLLRKMYDTEILDDDTYPPNNPINPIWCSRKVH